MDAAGDIDHPNPHVTVVATQHLVDAGKILDAADAGHEPAAGPQASKCQFDQSRNLAAAAADEDTIGIG